MNKYTKNKGFTLVEMLAGIGILVALLAIAIPTISKLSRTLTQQQADDYAKSIYLAIQDELASKRTDGSRFQGEYASIYVDDSKGAALKDEIAEMLAELSEGKTTRADLAADLMALDEDHNYVYITTDDRSALEELLPRNSIDESIFRSGCEVTVIFNKETGDVLHVRYETGKAVGRYDGGVISGRKNILQEIVPTVQFVNGQECYIKIIVPIPDLYRTTPQYFMDRLTYTITVSDAADADNNYFRYRFTKEDYNANVNRAGGYDTRFEMNYATGVGRWTLDSLNPENGSFADKRDNCEDRKGTIPAGSDVQVVVQCTFDDPNGSDVELQPGMALGNPLFDQIRDGVIRISNGRNLQNLNELDEAVAANVTGAEITKHIFWDETAYYYGSRIASGDILRFVPLNTVRFKDGAEIALSGNVSGAAARISNLYVNLPGEEEAGLFGILQGTAENLILADPCVRTEKGNAGALAAVTQGAVIRNCSVEINEQAESYAVYGAKAVGLLVGRMESGSLIGGSVSMADGQKAKVCGTSFGLAAGDVESGRISGVALQGAIIGGSSGAVGGAVGYANGGTYENVTADVRISGVSVNTDVATKNNAYQCPVHLGAIGDFAGHIAKGEFKNCDATKGDNTYHFFGTIAVTTKTDANFYFAGKLLSGTVEADQTTASSTDLSAPKQFENTEKDVLFTEAVQDYASTYVRYAAGIKITGCKYNTDKNYLLNLQDGDYFYLYDQAQSKHQYSFREVTDTYSSSSDIHYLITDRTGTYALNITVKEDDPTAEAFSSSRLFQELYGETGTETHNLRRYFGKDRSVEGGLPRYSNYTSYELSSIKIDGEVANDKLVTRGDLESVHALWINDDMHLFKIGDMNISNLTCKESGDMMYIVPRATTNTAMKLFYTDALFYRLRAADGSAYDHDYMLTLEPARATLFDGGSDIRSFTVSKVTKDGRTYLRLRRNPLLGADLQMEISPSGQVKAVRFSNSTDNGYLRIYVLDPATTTYLVYNFESYDSAPCQTLTSTPY